MNVKVLIGIVVVILVLVGGYFLLSPRPSGEVSAPAATPTPSPTPTPQPAPSPTPSPTPPAAGEPAVEMTAQGFSPSTLTVSSGTTVRFVNRDSVAHWPASGVHPTHQVCPGFDALRPVEPGASYSFTFSVAKTCPMHDHLNPATRGSISVQ